MSRVHFTTLFSSEALEEALANGLVNKRKHPIYNIWIYNYSAATQFSWEWNDVTLNCRGLVLDEDGYIVARSFPKFFSYEQLEGNLPQGNYVVEEKLDGSMLMVFTYNGQIVTATRGSFESEQAIDAVPFLPIQFTPNGGATFIFEYIASTNRIVCKYDYEGLVLLAGVSIDGEEYSPKDLDFIADVVGLKRPKVYSFNSLEEILSYEEPNIEGFILRYENGERVKIKTEEYKRLHRLLTDFNEKDVWEALKEGNLNSVLEEVPDEMYDFVKGVEATLLENFNHIKTTVESEFKDLGDRKSNALYYKECSYPGLLFNLLDGKDISETIWKMIKPKVTTTYKISGE